MKTRNEKIMDRAAHAGSRAATPDGAARFLIDHFDFPFTRPDGTQPVKRCWEIDRLRPGDEIELSRDKSYDYTLRTIEDSDLLRKAADVIGPMGQRTNYGPGRAQIYGPAFQARWEDINYRGDYKGYTGRYLYHDYQSCLAVSRSGRSACLIQECQLKRRLIAPPGLRFEADDNGVCVKRESDGMDYHPDLSDWRSKRFWTIVRQKIAQNWKKRAQSRKLEQVVKRTKQAFVTQAPSVRVTLEDSRRCGYCVEGSLQFAEYRLGLKREDIIAGGHLFSVPGARLLKTNDDRASNVVRRAWLRETTVSI